jgi:hypothetical protein
VALDVRVRSSASLQVPGQVLVHLEHGHLLRAEDRLELAVGQDLAPVLRVLAGRSP